PSAPSPTLPRASPSHPPRAGEGATAPPGQEQQGQQGHQGQRRRRKRVERGIPSPVRAEGRGGTGEGLGERADGRRLCRSPDPGTLSPDPGSDGPVRLPSLLVPV